jgi:hypothetical protein
MVANGATVQTVASIPPQTAVCAKTAAQPLALEATYYEQTCTCTPKSGQTNSQSFSVSCPRKAEDPGTRESVSSTRQEEDSGAIAE